MSGRSVYKLARSIGKIPPGHCIAIDIEIMADIVPLPGWTEAETVMENIVGSAYEFYFKENPEKRKIVFYRLSEPLKNNLRTHVSPDRRWAFRKRSDGLWEPDLCHGALIN